jgi:hypothetical protein
MLACLMSIGGIIYFINLPKSIFTEETVGCRISDQVLVCDGENYDPTNEFKIYSFNVYFLEEGLDYKSYVDPETLNVVFQGSGYKLYFTDLIASGIDLFSEDFSITSIEEAAANVSTVIITASVVTQLFRNIFLIMIFVLISSISFLRYKNYIEYKKMFKLIVFAVTPITIIFALYNMIQFEYFIFIILLFISYRSVFVLQREIYQRVLYKKLQDQQQHKSQDDDVVESYSYDDIEQNDVEDEDDEE